MQWKQNKVGSPKVAEANLVGLIDTGSDFCRIDSSLAKRVGLTKSGEIESYAADGLKTKTDVFYGQLYFPEAQLTFDASMPSGPFREAENFDVILGMDFLRLFYVRILVRADLVDLEFVGQ